MDETQVPQQVIFRFECLLVFPVCNKIIVGEDVFVTHSFSSREGIDLYRMMSPFSASRVA